MSELGVRVDPPGIAWVVIDRPARRNAVTLAMWQELAALFAGFGARRDIRAVVLTGAGGHFSAGADITEFAAVRGTAAQAEAYERAVDACTRAIAGLLRPTIAAIDGVCAGGGCGLAMACDFRVASRSARLGIPAARLGVVYGVPDSRHLLALVGLAGAKRILFGGQLLEAAEAARIGLVDELADGAAADAARAWAEALAANAPLSIAGAKQILHALVEGREEARGADIRAAMQRSAASRDYREAVRAFAEKRRPAFTGE